jgi:3-oxoacyl-[acyl-carrier protein] reductase
VSGEKWLEGKTAVITDANQAVGRAVARLFAAHGAALALGAGDLTQGEELLAELDVSNSFVYYCDLSDAGSVEGFCTEVNRRWQLVNILVNNPWTEESGAFETAEDRDDSRILQIYQHSLVQTMRAFWPRMIKAGSCSVIQISSCLVVKPTPGSLARAIGYGAHGGLTRVPAVEGGIHEVRVNEIYAAYGVNTEKRAYAPLKVSGVERDGRADVAGAAKAALFLASDMASYISGASISVTGGVRAERLAAVVT